VEGVPSEVRPLVERLNELFSRIHASVERERAFTADAAHELRTPLAAIRAQAEVARASEDDASRRRALGQVIAGCDRAARLSEQLLTLARLESGEWRERLGPCDLAVVAREVVAELAATAHTRGVALAFVASGPASVRGDAPLLHVLIRNLVDNAVRYGAAGEQVRVSLETQAAGVLLRVEDEGPGIAASERAFVLGRFRRGLGTKESGAGLGLAIVQRIAELHEASLTLAEGPHGRGLSVLVRFPTA
jgi:two-component system sensor histidine kinase QseC